MWESNGASGRQIKKVPTEFDMVKQELIWQCNKTAKGKEGKIKKRRGGNDQGWNNGGSVEIKEEDQ